jgi:hypothetical protein
MQQASRSAKIKCRADDLVTRDAVTTSVTRIDAVTEKNIRKRRRCASWDWRASSSEYDSTHTEALIEFRVQCSLEAARVPSPAAFVFVVMPASDQAANLAKALWTSSMFQRVVPLPSFTGLGSRPDFDHRQIVEGVVSNALAKVLAEA